MPLHSPRTISFFIASGLALISVILLYFSLKIQNIGIPAIYYAGILLILLVSGYLLTRLLIGKFIYRRIKTLYNSISIFRSNKALSEMNPDMRTDILDTVSKDVAKWMVEKHNTIDRLEEREAFRREFIGNLSHELKTPVFSVQGYILTLLEGGLEDKDINRKFLEKAAKSVDRITHILNDLDQISRLESGHLNIEPETFDISRLVYDVCDEMDAMAKKKKISLKPSFPRDKTVGVVADQGKIAQVLSNLIINSINYGKKKGYIHIKLHREEDKIWVDVEDDGIGISEEDMSRIFERFYRVEKSRARQKGGTGLGLAIVKHIIDAHNETITVRSTPGEGSVFSFSLPAGKF